ncbi:acyltransferase family protein [Pseudobutyrivibrio sp.]
MASSKRDIWVDNVKVIACILVVLGHFFQSMVKANLLADSFAYNLFEDTIYYFHVPLFFICSGYLYQKYSVVNDISAWKINVLKKLIALGIPYFVFSFATWILKKVFASSVNTEIGGLGYTLFKHPTSPYWYLYILFVLFVITWTSKNVNQQYLMLVISVCMKLAYTFGVSTGLYIIDNTLANCVWFVLGMTMAYGVIKMTNAMMSILLFMVFLLGSALTELGYIHFKLQGFIWALMACYSVISLSHYLYNNGVQSEYMATIAKYTMPIFLMHTLFAAPFRSVLIKLGVDNLIIHIVIGLVASFVCPVIAMIIMEKIKPLDFMIYPNRYISIKRRQ